jgi:Holliday junction DNA helicase RuvA
MITQVEGKFVELTDQAVVLDVHGVAYEVHVTSNLLRGLGERSPGDPVRLVTYHYLQTDPSKSLPVLIGFANKIEREFFEKFITVSGIGPKGALRALTVPISQIAQAIDASDVPFLKTLPGVGEQRAREIVAKLQGKVGRFGLIQDGPEGAPAKREAENFKEEALAVLLQLQYKREEARRMIEEALRKNRAVRSAEELLNEVYRQRTLQPQTR